MPEAARLDLEFQSDVKKKRNKIMTLFLLPALIQKLMIKQTTATYLQLIKRLILVVYIEISSGECPKPSSSPRSLADALCRKEPSSEGMKVSWVQQ